MHVGEFLEADAEGNPLVRQPARRIVEEGTIETDTGGGGNLVVGAGMQVAGSSVQILDCIAKTRDHRFLRCLAGEFVRFDRRLGFLDIQILT
ncbi:hypothetical protein DOT67_24650 [Ralstonia pseudosolanacearum]|uniref:Uncharacterized protein n=1 Tax=Ralstonia pseudosolanacearum TaxID=1310165 RepID=A0A454TIV5_9RALS|nr:hypothetical protein DOT67_24650 [Ralstonia pseudosolanacearum]RNM00464.1 hypothetical protein EGA29_24985 [Ralstonia pseudosolanacearum]TYZ39538.1 hypothetical protein C2U33_24695 [Ralstonia solanacearum]